MIVAKGLFKLPNLHTKTKESIISEKHGSRDFWQIANSVLNKGKSAKPSLVKGLEVLSSVSDQAKLFAKTFSNCDDSGISLPNLKLHNISISPKMIKKVITWLKVFLINCRSSNNCV